MIDHPQFFKSHAKFLLMHQLTHSTLIRVKRKKWQKLNLELLVTFIILAKRTRHVSDVHLGSTICSCCDPHYNLKPQLRAFPCCFQERTLLSRVNRSPVYTAAMLQFRWWWWERHLYTLVNVIDRLELLYATTTLHLSFFNIVVFVVFGWCIRRCWASICVSVLVGVSGCLAHS